MNNKIAEFQYQTRYVNAGNQSFSWWVESVDGVITTVISDFDGNRLFNRPGERSEEEVNSLCQAYATGFSYGETAGKIEIKEQFKQLFGIR